MSDVTRPTPSPAELAAMGAVRVVLDRERWLIFDLDALYLLETITGSNALTSDLLNPLTATNLRLMLYAALRREDPTLTVDDIGTWLPRHETERVKAAIAAVTAAWTGQRPEAKESARPPEAGDSSEPQTSGQSLAAQA